MLEKLTWKNLLEFLNEEQKNGSLPEDDDVLIHNVETGDEYACDVFRVDDRLVVGVNWSDEDYEDYE